MHYMWHVKERQRVLGFAQSPKGMVRPFIEMSPMIGKDRGRLKEEIDRFLFSYKYEIEKSE